MSRKSSGGLFWNIEAQCMLSVKSATLKATFIHSVQYAALSIQMNLLPAETKFWPR